MNYSDIAIVFMSRFRRKRLVQLRTALNEVGCRTVLDVGGTAQIWDMLGGSQEVTLLNNDPQELGLGSYKAVTGDGRCLPFLDKSFDLVFSNSVIEHVGDWHDMQRLASELRRVGKSFYCQTPNKWFPVEPHLGTFFLHWCPRLLSFFVVARYCTVWGLVNKPRPEQVEKSIAGIRLLTKRDLRRLFPESSIVAERFFFLSKSYIVTDLRQIT